MVLHRSIRAGAVAIMGLAIAGVGGAFAATSAVAAPAAAGPHLVALKNSVSATTDKIMGAYNSPRMSVEVALAPRDSAGLSQSLKAMYTKGSSSYHHWLHTGQFDARYAPTSATRETVVSYLKSEGLRVTTSASPFLVRAAGSSRQMSTAFHTTLSNYRDPRGVRYFSNSTAVKLPAAVAAKSLGVIGLTNSVREHSMVHRIDNVIRPAGASRPPRAAARRPARLLIPPSSKSLTRSSASAASRSATAAARAATA